ncbi:hypothetical protein DFJ74DRAFT_365690 [Hyaloraphidium curvatum]|nr:hypothetical protein DFJ74DRAFT_365690 [Hyaloraphidium curvatum]
MDFMDLGGPPPGDCVGGRVAEPPVFPKVDRKISLQLPYLAPSSSQLFSHSPEAPKDPGARFEAEAAALLMPIVSGLGTSLLAGDWYGGKANGGEARVGVVGWIRKLRQYTDMKLPLPAAQRAVLIRTLFAVLELPTSRNPSAMSDEPLSESPQLEGPDISSYNSRLDPGVLDPVLGSLARLLKKREELESLPEGDKLQLDWRPLWKAWKGMMGIKGRDRMTPSETKPLTNLLAVTDLARHFFRDPVASRDAMLREFLPLVDHESGLSSTIAYQALGGFLPYDFPDGTQDPYEHLPVILALYLSSHSTSIPPTSLLTLLSRSARASLRLSSPAISVPQLRTATAAALGMGGAVELPIGPGKARSGIAAILESMGGAAGDALGKAKGEGVRGLAELMVWSARPDIASSEGIWEILEEAVAALDTWFHPSNTGKWTQGLVRWLAGVAEHTLLRWREERAEDSKIPEKNRLTGDHVRSLAAILRPPLLLAAYGKDGHAVAISHQALRQLAWLDPEGTIPPCLEAIGNALVGEGAASVHRTSASIQLLSQLALPMLTRSHFPAGAANLVPLLQAALPGIDMNDPGKTRASLSWILAAVGTVPLIDAGAVSRGEPWAPKPKWRVTGAAVGREEGRTRSPDAESDGSWLVVEGSGEEAELELRDSTALFAAWVDAFLDRVFLMFQNLPQGFGSSGANQSEDQVMAMLMPTCSFIFNHCPPDVIRSSISRIRSFALANCIPNATKPMGRLVGSVGGYDPSAMLDVFLPLAADRIAEELSHGASSRPLPGTAEVPSSDGPLHWWQSIAYNACQTLPANEMLRRLPLVEPLLELTLDKCKSDRGFRYAGKLLRRIVKSLVDVYPLETRCVDPQRWEDQTHMGQHYAHWGEMPDPGDLGTEWNVPGDAEKDAALRIVETWGRRALQRLEEIRTANGAGAVGEAVDPREASNEIVKNLGIVKNCLSGMQSMFAEPNVPNSVRKRVEAGYAFSDPSDPRFQRARQLRESFGSMLHDMVVYLRQHREDDIEAFKVLTKVIGVFICDSSLNPGKYDQVARSYSWYKSVIRTPEHGHRLPRWMLVNRLYAAHLYRLKNNNLNLPRTPIVETLLVDLAELSLARYAKVRQYAQSFLSVSLRVFPSAVFELAPKAIAVLEQPPAAEEEDALKGALYLLQSDRFGRACLTDFNLLQRFVTALTKAQYAEKPTLQELIRKNFLESLGRYADISIRSVRSGLFENPVADMAAAFGVQLDASLLSRTRGEVDAADSIKADAYKRTVDSLLEVAASPNTHWRYGSMALNYLEQILRDDLPVSPALTEVLLRGVLSEIPHIRRASISLVCRILQFIKRRAGLLAPGTNVASMAKQRTSVGSPLPADYTEHYLSSSLSPPTDSTVFSDRLTTGFFCWPASYKTYRAAPERPQGTLPYSDPTSAEASDLILRTLSDAVFWSRHMAYVSQEASGRNGGEMAFEVFDAKAAKFYKTAFAHFEDTFLETCVAPLLEQYCRQTGEKSKQRAAAELAAGLVRGMKHWPLAKQQKTWAWLAPLILGTMMACGPEALGYWTTFLVTAMRNRDPRRLLPLIDGILSLRLDPNSESFFNETKKVELIQIVFEGYCWRLRSGVLPILDSLLANVRNPYEKVREMIGLTVNDVLQSVWSPSFASAAAAVEAFAARGDGGTGGIFPTDPDAEVMKRLEPLLRDMAKWRGEGEVQRAANVTAVTDYGSACKTVTAWIGDALAGPRLQGTLPYIHRGLLQEVLAMVTFSEQELQKRAQGVLSLYGVMPQPPASLREGLAILTGALKSSTSWHLRQSVLPVIQIAVFRHLFVLDPPTVNAVMEAVAGMLTDPQIEVRQLAATSLSGLVRCSQRESIDLLRARFSDILRKTRIPARQRGPAAPPPTAEYNDAVLRRHSAVLGLGALVRSFPYEVPAWMPGVLTTLAACLDDPSPIGSGVRAVFADFVRTHQDTWELDRAAFTPDELELLSGALMGQSYYV